MDRRRFLSLSLASLTLTGCGGGSGGSDNTTSVTVPNVDTSDTSIAWSELADQLDGGIILQETQGYNNARLVFNVRYDHVMPQAIVRCQTSEDVINTLAFVQENNLAVTPRCGGHGYAGYSTTDGVVIDLTPMDSIEINGNTATIGAGARLVDVYDQLSAAGVGIPLGSCLSVGISGLTLGGGIGVIDRAYGLTCDNLLAVDMITADGRSITCSADQEPELFWALKGGGGGNFGVATSFTFATHATSDITVCEAYYSFDDFAEVMFHWQQLAASWPNEMWAQIIPNWTTGSPTVFVRAFCLNARAQAEQLWDAFIQGISATPISNQVSTDSYRNTMLGNCENSIPACHISTQFPDGQMSRSAFAASSDYFDQTLPEDAINTLIAYIEQSIEDGNYGMIIFNTMAGAIADVAPTDSAFVHRNSLLSAEYYSPLAITASDQRIDETQEWKNSFRQLMSPWSSGGAYVNYIDPLIENWQQAYYGENYPQLQNVKSQFDPQGVFNLPQGIEPL